MSTFLRAAIVVVVVLAALAFLAMWGLSEDGLEESKEQDAREAGVSRACYDAIADSLREASFALKAEADDYGSLEYVTYHEDIVRAARQDARMVRALCPTEL